MTTQGKCPKCRSPLDYGNTDIDDDAMAYHVSCPDCGWRGYEMYALEFQGHMDAESNGAFLEPSEDSTEDTRQVEESADNDDEDDEPGGVEV